MSLDLDEVLTLHVLIHRQEEDFEKRPNNLTDYEKNFMVPMMREIHRKIHARMEAEKSE